MTEEMIALETIENKKITWKLKMARNIETFEEIARNINSSKTNKEKKFWGDVMDLHRIKRNKNI